ncbi:MAG: helix-turn-helix transcriptional regulator [Pseudomonadota bacterium]|nr:helix-turn-helix transcriptional regulator [Pseudomonadota bacterium]
MIERCIRQFRQGACATCDRKPNCPAARWQQAFAFAGPAAAAELPVRRANSILAFLGEVANAFERRARPPKQSFRAEVERTLEPLLAGGEVGIDRVAGELGCSRQTLYRRLKAENVTFEQVLDKLRHRLALGLVRQGHSIKEVSYRLGFSDPAAFSRAFKRWTGFSPGSMRS